MPSLKDELVGRAVAKQFTVVANEAEIMLDTKIAIALANARMDERSRCSIVMRKYGDGLIGLSWSEIATRFVKAWNEIALPPD